MEKKIDPGRRQGIITVPASKSDGQRALLAAALAGGTSVLTGWGNSHDELAMQQAIGRLGAQVNHDENGNLRIEGIARFPESAELSAGESGLGIRLLSFVCAAHPGDFRINGEGSLSVRPMDFIEKQLPRFGAFCATNNGYAPLHVAGPMKGTSVAVDGSLSSQFISGLLMSLPLVDGDSRLQVEDLKSGPYVEMTLKTLSEFGIRIHRQKELFSIPGNQRYRPAEYPVDADWSSAGYWLVAAALGHEIGIRGLRTDSLQADKALIGFLETAGCEVIEHSGILTVNGKGKKTFEADATNCPDLFPTLAVLAAFCTGCSCIRGVSRLVHKESHRGLTIQSEFAKLGVHVELNNDEMHIFGTGSVSGGTIDSHNDHRIAMAFAIAGLSSDQSIFITGAEAVRKSYPDFWKHLESLEIRNS